MMLDGYNHALLGECDTDVSWAHPCSVDVFSLSPAYV